MMLKVLKDNEAVLDNNNFYGWQAGIWIVLVVYPAFNFFASSRKKCLHTDTFENAVLNVT